MIQLESYNLKIVMILTIGFAFASILGYITQRIKFSPILGYLIAGYLIGPYSPGVVVDMQMSEQLAEIGVILMLFSVGLHFQWKDLIKVRNIAIPGALVQTTIATCVGTALLYSIGWSIYAGIVMGLAIGVASTVVLVRVLSDNNLLDTIEGHICIGWLIIEDLITVFGLLLLPIIALTMQGTELSALGITGAIVLALLKFLLLALIALLWGRKLTTYLLLKVARTESNELFTLTILALIFVIATGSALLFGTSIALGAFMAGMVIGQTEARHQASANSLPLKDAFLVLFFLSTGMLFNPMTIVNYFPLFLAILGIVLIIKPLTAFFIVRILKYPVKTGVTIAIALAQIGEFSFILTEQALKFEILPDEGFDLIIACALVAISINPVLFRSIEWLSALLDINKTPIDMKEKEEKKNPAIIPNFRKALVIGFGTIGEAIVKTLESLGFFPTIIDNNMDIISNLRENKRDAVYGEASQEQVLKGAQIGAVQVIVVAIPDARTAKNIVKTAHQLNPKAHIWVQAKYASDRKAFHELGAHVICSEEETMKAFSTALSHRP